MENIISKISSKILPVVALAMSLYHLWQVMMPSMDPTVHQDIHLAFALTLPGIDQPDLQHYFHGFLSGIYHLYLRQL